MYNPSFIVLWCEMSTAPESPFGFYANLSDDENDRPPKVKFERKLNYSKCLFSPGADDDSNSTSQVNTSICSVSSDLSECSRSKTDVELSPVKRRMQRGSTLIFAILFIGVLAYIDFINNSWLQRTITSFLLRSSITSEL